MRVFCELPHNRRMPLPRECPLQLCSEMFAWLPRLEEYPDTSQHDPGRDRLYSERQSERSHATGAQTAKAGSQPHAREAQQKRPAIKMVQIIERTLRPEMKAGQRGEHDQTERKLWEVFH